MKPLLLILLAGLFAGTLNAEPSDPTKVFTLARLDRPIRVDGVIDSAWFSVDSLTDFVQYSPFHGKVPSKRTTVKMASTENSLYCLVLCEDDPAAIQRNTGKLDDGNGDVVSLMLDTFGDKRTAYKFAVTASGSRSDSRLLDDARNRDYHWDGVWFAESKVYDWGFAVEMEIPYRSIQYDAQLSEWGLDFDRWIAASKEDIYWCRYEEVEGQRVSKFGSLRFRDFRPSVKGLNLEIYPVAIGKATYLRGGNYKTDPDAGIDIFYNPSQKLTFQLTANPDFAQIEADPFNFNISRYESYFDERRPFFTEGNEVFTPAGRDRNSGFYRPLELFYSRRIGKYLPDGSEVPLTFGTKAFGRVDDWEYGGFVAMTGEREYEVNGLKVTEPRASFGSARIKTQIMGNSSVGLLFVGKHTKDDDHGVVDIDGAFRATDWQLAYQLARSVKNSEGDFAGSAGMTVFKDSWMTLVRGRHIGERFDVSEVGFVPWRGTSEITAISGPRWYFEEGTVRQILLYTGLALNYERVDEFTDRSGIVGFNMQFRDGWGFEMNSDLGRSKDLSKEFTSYSASISTWFNVSPTWYGNMWGGYSRTYNFARNWLAFYSWAGTYAGWNITTTVNAGSSLGAFIEGNPDGGIEDITYNARPFVSLTPVNDLNLRVYADHIFVRSSGQLEQLIVGFLFSYNFLPKSWIYFAVNEARDRSPESDALGAPLPERMHVASRAAVVKVKYLYYF